MISIRLVPVVAALAASTPAATLARPIQDNSFLIEEAYNQEPGVIQHISTFLRSDDTGAWGYSFTEEWPVLGQTHQASVTLTLMDLKEPDGRGLGDVLLNYRWQAVGSGDAPVAFAPRLTVSIPSGDADRGLGYGAVGLEGNLPLSVELSRRLVSHVNLGGRYVRDADLTGMTADLAIFTVGQSFVWLAHEKLNLLVETVYSWGEFTWDGGSARAESLMVSPGLRAAIDVGELQIVPGIAFPFGLGPDRGVNAVFLYLSLEHPFRLAGARAEGS